MCKAQLPFALLSETFLTIRQNSLYVTVCMIVRTFYQGYFIHSLSTLYYYNAPSLTTRLTGDYRDRTCTGKRGPALLDTPHKKRQLPSNCQFKNYFWDFRLLAKSSNIFCSRSLSDVNSIPISSNPSCRLPSKLYNFLSNFHKVSISIVLNS